MLKELEMWWVDQALLLQKQLKIQLAQVVGPEQKKGTMQR